MAIQSDETLVTKGDLKTLYTDKILPYLGGNMMMSTNVGDCYNTDEKIVGIWTDNKPLYQKTFVSTLPTLTTTGEVKKDITIGASVDNIVNIYGCFNYYNTNNMIIIPYSSDAGNVYLFGRPDNTSTTASKNTIGIAVNPKTVDAASRLSENSIVFTVLYTKTTDTTSTALTAPGCYDLNRPDLWPENKEIFFGNGLYGYRAVGTASVTANTLTAIKLNVMLRNIISSGGYGTYNSTGDYMALNYHQGDEKYALSLYGHVTDGLYISYKVAITHNAHYDIWVTYTK